MGATAKNKQVDISDRELDEILASVEDSLSKANLSKSASALPKGDPNGGLKKDDMPGEKKPEGEEAPAPEAAPAGGAPAEAAPPAPEAGGAPEEGAPAEGAPAPEAGAPAEGDMAQEAEQPLSDEELQQIYGAMEPEELQRHYMVIRQFLEQHMGQADAQPAPAPAPEAAPPGAPAMKSEAVQKSEKTPAAPAENDEVKSLKAKIEELEKGLSTAVKAVELVLQPARKSVAGVEFIKKNEELEGKGSQEDFSKLTKTDIDARYRKIGIANFSKNERDTVNAFLLRDEGKDKVLDIIKSKGSK